MHNVLLATIYNTPVLLFLMFYLIIHMFYSRGVIVLSHLEQEYFVNPIISKSLIATSTVVNRKVDRFGS